MSKFAINPNALPDPLVEERAALDRDNAHLHHFDDDGAGPNAPVAGKAPLPPAMSPLPDPRFPHGDIDLVEHRLALLKSGRAPTEPPQRPTPGAAHPLIVTLLAALPPADSEWSARSRADWLRAAEGIFGLVYRDGAGSDS